MKQYQYSVTIIRHEIEDEDNVVDTTELVDQWITADSAIELMMHIKENIADINAESEEDEEESEEEDEPEPAPRVTKKQPVQKTRRTGVAASYDVDAMKADIKDGMKPQAIASKYGVSVASVYQRKADMKKAGELDEQEPAAKLPASFGKMSEPDDDDIDEDLERDVADAIRDGETLQSLTMSFPSAPLPVLKKLFDKYSS